MTEITKRKKIRCSGSPSGFSGIERLSGEPFFVFAVIEKVITICYTCLNDFSILERSTLWLLNVRA